MKNGSIDYLMCLTQIKPDVFYPTSRELAEETEIAEFYEEIARNNSK